MELTESRPIIFTAQSKYDFYCRNVVCEFVLRQGCVPLNPFRVFDYFLDDRVDRDLVRRGNFNIVRVADEVWVFGTKIANGVLAEVEYARKLNKPVKFFTISADLKEIKPVGLRDVEFEHELFDDGTGRDELFHRLSSTR